MALSDKDIAQILDRTVATTDRLLDVLATADPLDLKPRTFRRGTSTNCLDRGAGAASQVLNVLDWPGTAGWDKLPMLDRADWWVSRVGLITTGGVAFPSVFGAWTKKLPMADYLGFASQALVLRAVSREYGVTSRSAGIAMLASILFDRDLDAHVASTAVDARSVKGLSVDGVPDDAPSGTEQEQKQAFVARLWRVGRTLYDLSQALGDRPGSPKLLSWMGWLPLVGGPASYFGEVIALRRSASACRKWIVAHPETVEPVGA